MIQTLISDLQIRMDKSIKALQDALLKLRVGRASPDILEGLLVSYYGKETPLNQMASIVVEGALMLSIKPWDKKAIPFIEKAIQKSDLGVNPTPSGDILRLSLPPLTEDRRKDLIKKVRAEGEHARVSVRTVRRDANTALKALLKDKKITEDDERRTEEKIQKMTDQHIAHIEKILSDKEKALMEI